MSINKLHHRSIVAKGMRYSFMAVLVMSLYACSSEKHDDLQSYVKQVKARQKGRVAPLPEVTPYATFSYSANDLRDPFTTFADNDEDKCPPVCSGPRPDTNRKPEALEKFPLDSLSFVGHIEKDNVSWGLISAPDGTVYRVQVDNYMGKNYGQITSITDSTIELKELIPNGLGGWEERKASISLSE